MFKLCLAVGVVALVIVALWLFWRVLTDVGDAVSVLLGDK